MPATVLLREIRAQGYTGGISQLKAYLAPMKPMKDDRSPVVRFETEGKRICPAASVDSCRARRI